MNFNEYQKLASRTINQKLSKPDRTAHGLTGMVSEIGEIASLHQHEYQGKPFCAEKAMDELGDLLWFAAEYAGALGYSLDAVAEKNIAKLRKRYPEGFSEERSENRHSYGED